MLALTTGLAAQGALAAGSGMVMAKGTIAAGVKAPDINYQDTSGAIHPLRNSFNDEYTVVVFTGEKSCATEDSPLIKSSKRYFAQNAPATIVEIVGGDKGCTPNQKACVLKRSLFATKLITLCDAFGEARKEYHANDLTSIYLIDPSGTIVETASFDRLDDVLEKTTYLAQKLDDEQIELYYD